MQHVLLTLALILLSFAQSFGVQLRGTVRDEEGQALPSVNIYLANTTYGVISNLKGEFFLELEPGTHQLVFSLYGYEKKEVTVKMGQDAQTLEVTLVPVSVELEEVKIEAGRKDPAYAIIKEVIAHKKEFLRQFETFQCSTYLKVSLEVDDPKAREKEQDSTQTDKAQETALPPPRTSGPVQTSGLQPDQEKKRLNFLESFSTTSFRAPNEYKSIIYAFRDYSEKSVSSVEVSFGEDPGDAYNSSAVLYNPLLFYTDISEADFNFYENLVNVPALGPQPFVSPISSSALIYYKYKLEDKILQNGRVIYKIKVIPRAFDGALFEGHLFIVDQVWAIQSLNLEIQPLTLHFFDKFRLIHDYEQNDQGKWLLTREEYYYDAKRGKKRYYGNSLALHSDYKIDVDFPKNHFKNEVRRIEDEAFDKDTLFWQTQRPVSLKLAEMSFVREQDSIRAWRTSDVYLDSIDTDYNKVKFLDFIIFGLGFRNRAKKREIYINPLLSQLQPFGVGGYRHALGGTFSKAWSRSHKLSFDGEVNYGFNNQDIKGQGRLRFLYDPKHFGRVMLKAGDQYTLINTYESIAAFLSRSNFIRKIHFGVGHERELVNGLYLDLEAEWADRRSIEGIDLAEWSNDLFGDLNDPVDFQEYRELLFDVKVRFTPNQKYQTEPYKKIIIGSKWPTFQVHYKKAVPGLFGASNDFDFLEFSAKQEIDVGKLGTSRWNLYTGKFLRGPDIRFTDYKFFRGSDRFFFSSPLKSFQLLGPTISTRNAYFQAHYVHHFDGFLMNKIPLLRRLKMDAVGGLGILMIEDGNFRHAEGFVGLQVPFRMFKTLMKFGVYWVGADSNHSRLDNTIKIGINFFDSFRNKWYY